MIRLLSLTLLLIANPAGAHPTRSKALMDALTRADVGVGLILARCEYHPPEDPDIRHALALLDDAVAASELTMASCDSDLFPAPVRALDAETRRAYGEVYVQQLAAFADNMRAQRDEFTRQRALPREERDASHLRELKRQMRNLSNQAHRVLINGAPVADEDRAG